MECFCFGIFFPPLSSSFLSSLDAFYLSVPENYHYLNQSGCIADKTISDKDSFKEVIVSCFPSSLRFKNAGGSGAWGPLTEQGTKPSCAYLHKQLSPSGTTHTGAYIFSYYFTVILNVPYLPSYIWFLLCHFKVYCNLVKLLHFGMKTISVGKALKHLHDFVLPCTLYTSASTVFPP